MIEPIKSKRFLQDFDWVLLAAACFLSVISLIEIYSATMNEPSEAILCGRAYGLLWYCFPFHCSALDYHVISSTSRGSFIVALYISIRLMTERKQAAASKTQSKSCKNLFDFIVQS